MIFSRLHKLSALADVTLFPLYRWAVRNEFFKCAAILASLTIFALNGRRERRLLFLDRSIFRLDLETMAKVSDRVQYVGVQRKYFKEVLDLYFCDLEFSETTYHHDKSLDQAKKRTRAAFEKILLVLHRLIRFDGIITCNFGYPDQQEIFSIAREKNWPIVILYKEGLLPKNQLDELFQEYRKKYLNCDLLLCYNEGLARLFYVSDVPGSARTIIKPVGVPRLDVLRDGARARPKKQVVFFSFFPEDKIRFAILKAAERLEIESVASNFHKNVVRLALENPDLSVVIKTKTAPKYLRYVDDIVRASVGDKELPSNLRITNEGSALDLIKESAVVLGSHSTTLIEGLLAGRPVGCPLFPQWFESEHNFLPSEVVGIRTISNYDALLNLVKESAETASITMPIRSKGLEQLIFTTDFDASRRAEEEILELLSVTD